VQARIYVFIYANLHIHFRFRYRGFKMSVLFCSEILAYRVV